MVTVLVLVVLPDVILHTGMTQRSVQMVGTNVQDGWPAIASGVTVSPLQLRGDRFQRVAHPKRSLKGLQQACVIC